MSTTDTPAEPALLEAARAAAGRLDAETRRDFCVVVPAWNEAEMIPELVRELKAAFARYDLHGEVVLVDDGSTDGTGDLAEREATGWEALRVVRHPLNLGKTEAMVTGTEATSRRSIILFDADLQHLPDEIPRFLEALQAGWGIVTGRKVGSYEKEGISRVYNALSRRLFDIPVSDMNSMKAFRRNALLELHLRHDWHRYFVVLAHARGWSVTEIDITLFPRRAGVSKFTGPWRVVVGLLDLLSVGFLLRFSAKPLMLFGSLGALLVGTGTVVGIVALWLRFGLGFGFRPFLYLVILLVTVGVLLIGVGFLAEMVAQLRGEISDLRRQLLRGGGGEG
ncbi:MAG: glycosyltransferase family 2 protein [Longimicrobiales bacterium]|nr:glycosyltransferase family 2 protein [Longimicrobiales bacterium]